MGNDVWTTIKERLEPAIFGNVTIMADGFKVCFRREMFKYKSRIMTYVNAWFKGFWTKADDDGKAVHEEGRKFFRPHKYVPKSLFSKPLFKSKAEMKRVEKIMGKDWMKEDMTPRIIGYTPDWPNAKMLVSHLKRTCKEVCIVEDKTVV